MTSFPPVVDRLSLQYQSAQLSGPLTHRTLQKLYCHESGNGSSKTAELILGHIYHLTTLETTIIYTRES